MDDKRLAEVVKHIDQFQESCDEFLSPLCNPCNKKVLIIGSGWGTEVAWLLKQGAKEIVGIDPAPRPTNPLNKYIAEKNLQGTYKITRGTVDDITEEYSEHFDLIISHNVFEHIMNLEETFKAIPKLLNKKGRVAIFTAPLFFSSCGSHLNIKPWEHLWGNLDDIKSKVPPFKWSDYTTGMNKMTLTSFLECVINSGAIVTKLYTRPDRNIQEFPKYIDKILLKNKISLFDLTVEGISIEFFYHVDKN
ncbi:MAG: Unknown protein [uncultured Sulfurovum sp.]|uniref:Uncharacterized protein n=1 Tax=uncultured Sulfurovum sp. TaxID=269237 RepID=A0A6S6SZQ8_9BACT|nr:MAG: Unknown protein [uncultured Sulfurovum sp.]